MKYCYVDDMNEDVVVTVYDYLVDALTDALTTYNSMDREDRARYVRGDYTIMIGTYEVDDSGVPHMCDKMCLSTRWLRDLDIGQTYEDPEGAWYITDVQLLNNRIEVVSLDGVEKYVSPLEVVFEMKGGMGI